VTILTIASSKGGPGKTTLAELIVASLASEGLSMAALDADPTGGLSVLMYVLSPASPYACRWTHDASCMSKDALRRVLAGRRVARGRCMRVVDHMGCCFGRCRRPC